MTAPKSITSRLTELAAAAPDRPAVTCDGVTRSRRELDERTNAIARTFAGLGVRQGSFVTLALPNGLDFVEALVATWKIGATPQPVSAQLPSAERAEIVRLADSALVVGGDGPIDGRPHLPGGFTVTATDDRSPLPERVSPSWKAPTSGGSTGRPKLIISTEPARFDPQQAAALRMTPNGCQLVAGPLYHNGPFTMATFGLTAGAHLIVLPRFDPQRTLQAVAEHSVDWVMLVPTMMHRIWKLPPEKRPASLLASLQVVLHLGGPCPVWLKREWIGWLGPDRVWELYGGTEGQAVTVISGHEWLAHPGSVGRAARGEIAVLRPDGEYAAPGEIGEVALRPGAGKPPTYRYVGAEPRRVRTWDSIGDLGYLDRDGYLYLVGRVDDLVVSGGANIYPAEVSAALGQHPHVLSCFVFGEPDNDLGQSLHAIVESNAELCEDDLREFLADRLVRYKIPRRFTFVDVPVHDAAGKTRRPMAP